MGVLHGAEGVHHGRVEVHHGAEGVPHGGEKVRHDDEGAHHGGVHHGDEVVHGCGGGRRHGGHYAAGEEEMVHACALDLAEGSVCHPAWDACQSLNACHPSVAETLSQSQDPGAQAHAKAACPHLHADRACV